MRKAQSGTINLDELPLLGEETLVALIRLIRAVATAHKMYPVGHQMIERSVDRFFVFMLGLLKDIPRLVITAMGETLEFNGTRVTTPIPERDQAIQLSITFKKRGLESFVFVRQTTKQDVLRLFQLLFGLGEEKLTSDDLKKLQQSLPSLVLNPSITRPSMRGEQVDVDELLSTMDREELLQKLKEDPSFEKQLRKLQAERKARQQREDPQAYLNALPDYVKRGDFILQLLEHSPMADSWPTYWPQKASKGQESMSEGGGGAFFEKKGKKIPVPYATEKEKRLPFSSSKGFFEEEIGEQREQGGNLLEQIDLKYFEQISSHRFPPHLQPEKLVESPDFEEWLKSDKFKEYLDTYFATHLKLSQYFSLGDTEAEKQIYSEDTDEQIEETVKHLAQSLYKLQDPDIVDRFLVLISERLKRLVPELLNQYLVKLSSKDPTQQRLKYFILDSLSQARLVASQEDILRQLEKGVGEKGEPEQLVELLVEIASKQLSDGQLRKVRNMLEKLEKSRLERGSSEESWFQKGEEKLIERIAAEERLAILFKEGLKGGGEEARGILSLFAPQSIKRCAREIFLIEDEFEKNRRKELLIFILEGASEEKREAGFEFLFARLDDPEVGWKDKEFIFSLGRHYVPSLFEKWLIKVLSRSDFSSQLSLFLRQAMLHDTPDLRRLLLSFLERRLFFEKPEFEEMLLQYLHQMGQCDVFHRLSEWIHDEGGSVQARHSAIWMLGAFPSLEALRILGELLLKRTEDGEYVYSEEMRFQALHTLTRFHHLDVLLLLKGAEGDSSFLIANYARSRLVFCEGEGDLDEGEESLRRSSAVRVEHLAQWGLSIEQRRSWWERAKDKVRGLFR